MASNLFEAFFGSLTAEIFFDTLALTGGFCLYAMEFAVDLNEILQDLNNDLQIGETRTITQTEYIEMRMKFIEVIRFHSEAIELSHILSHVLFSDIEI